MMENSSNKDHIVVDEGLPHEMDMDEYLPDESEIYSKAFLQLYFINPPKTGMLLQQRSHRRTE